MCQNYANFQVYRITTKAGRGQKETKVQGNMTYPRSPKNIQLREADTECSVISPYYSGFLGLSDGWQRRCVEKACEFLSQEQFMLTPVLMITRSEEPILWVSEEYNFYIDQVKIGA